MIRSLQHFAENPDYGVGIYRRRLRFTSVEDHVIAQLDDTHHAAWLAVSHDSTQVTGIAAGFTRAPATTCPGAVAGLSDIVGMPMEGVENALRAVPMTANCTHLVDLAGWAIRHRDVGVTTYDIDVPDQGEAPVWISIRRNGATVHRWQVEGFTMAAPENLSGKPLMRGFAGWARTVFSGDTFMAAMMLQRGVFVARGRRYLVDRAPAIALSASEGMEGACWSYSGAQLETGLHSIGYVRDFTSGIGAALPDPLAHPSGLRS